MSDKPRWVYRFDNYKRAFLLLREVVEILEAREMNQLEKEGVIQRFEYTWELAWKTLKDYLDYKGIVLQTITPNSVIKEAVAAKIIDHGDVWMRALDARNKMSHSYNFKEFEKVIADIRAHYLAVFDALHIFLLEKEVEGL